MANRHLLALCALLAACQLLHAIPAKPGKIVYVQPDGTRIELYRHGDEFGHWTTDARGNVLRHDSDGFYRIDTGETAASVSRRAAQRRLEARSIRQAKSGQPVAFGKKHFLVILVEFKNKSFSMEDPNDAFNRQMNEPGYSVNGGTGSTRDFYYDNSHGLFEPVFDVYGPVKLNNDYSYYGKNSGDNDSRPEEAIIDGCKGLDEEIDFSRYDNDGDGKVDMVFMYYAGYGEADSGDSNTIWPHQWELSAAGKTLELDGVTVDSYACTNELNPNDTMCGVGTACHEFGHAMGLPDMYDTDYSTYGEAQALYDFSTMCGGAYNNDGRTPPYFNIEERIILGWLDESVFLEFGKTGTYTLPPVDENVAYRTWTDMEGEYFVYENRSKTGWDRYLPAFGMLAYHVDKSSRRVTTPYDNYMGPTTAHDLWYKWEERNYINGNGSHPCFYVVPAADPLNLDYGVVGSWIMSYFDTSKYPKLVFPGGATAYTPQSWNGVDGDISFRNIAYANGLVTLEAIVPTDVLDFNVIADKGSYKAGDRFTFELVEAENRHPETVAWYFDDEPVGADSVTLTKGEHTVEAVLAYADGRTERLLLEITAE